MLFFKKKFLLLILTTCFWACQTSGTDSKTPSTEVPKVVQTEKSATVEKVTLEALEKRLQNTDDWVYVYNFWATWCKPCIKEMPYFEKLGTVYADKKVKVVFVSLDFPDMLTSSVVPFVEKRNLQSEVVLLDAGNPNEWIDRIDKSWTGAIPATLFVNGTSGKRVFYEGAVTYEELVEKVEAMF